MKTEVEDIPDEGIREEWPACEQIGTLSTIEGKAVFGSEVVPIHAAGAEY